MFSWLRRRPALPAFQDRVWINDTARLAAVVRTAQSGPTLVITFFDETSQRVAKALAEAGVPFLAPDRGHPVRLTSAPVVLCLAERVGSLSGPVPQGLGVCVVEHHPHPDANAMLLEVLTQLGVAMPVFHVALDEPLMQRFGGDRLMALLEKLDVRADEPIEHPMVSRALGNAREKVGARVRSPQPARSMEEWLQLNYDPDRR